MGIGTKETDTSLRTTIDMLAGSLNRAGTRVVTCHNYIGTPYVGREVLPEVVYAYGLKEAMRGVISRRWCCMATPTRVPMSSSTSP
jgi:type III restriction enzyme